MIKLLLAIPLLAAALAVGPPSSISAAQVCTTPITDGTIKDSIVVPPGERCDLTNVIVRGGASVGEGATLDVRQSEIPATGSASIFLYLSTVRGSVTSTAVHAFIDTSEVRGDVTITDAVSPYVNHVTLSTIRGSLTFSHNSTTYQNTVAGNVIDVNLTCEGNAPPPVNGDLPNAVGGVKTGQCAGL